MSQSTISTMLQAIPLPAILVGGGEQILGANDRALKLLRPGIVGRHFITALRQPVVLDTIEACLRDGEQRTTRYLTNDGAQDTAFVVTCSAVETENVSAVLICFEDITHLEQADQMRRDFVANVSHELRSPLTALIGFIETLRGPARGDAEATERFLAIMDREALRMERLVRDLLSLSRVESEERVRPSDKIDVLGCLNTVLHTLRPQVRENRVTIETDLPEQPIYAPGDSDQLHQVFANLIENAIKYGREAAVEVSMTTTDNEPAVRGPAVIVSIRDHGPGIEEIHIPRLTERFYRVDNHRSREMGGTGLGLAIVKHIVNRHRGRLRISSTPGAGSEFRVILPLEQRA